MCPVPDSSPTHAPCQPHRATKADRNASHPDLAGNVVSGTSVLDGSDGLTDPNGHGTAMAGIIANQWGESSGTHRSALIGLGVALFLITIVVNLIAVLPARRAVRTRPAAVLRSE